MIIRDKETLSLLFNLAIASARLRKIIIEEPKRTITLRPQLHILLSGNKGSLKSTILSEVASYFKTMPFNDITEAGLIGSIDKEGNFIEGSAWTCKNGVMVLDEFEFMGKNFAPKGITIQLLSLTEHNQHFKKKVARMPRNKLSKRSGDLFYKVKGGEIEVKTNFSLIIGTMGSLNFQNYKLQALKSRCLAIKWYPDFKIILEVAKGERVFKYNDLLNDWEKVKKEVLISQEEYMTILNFVIDNFDDQELFLRALGDCCRVYAILKKHDLNVYRLVLSLKS